MGANRLAAVGEFRPDTRVDTRHGLGNRDRLKTGEEVLDERLPPRARRTVRANDPVKELAHCDHTDRALLLAEKVLNGVISLLLRAPRS
jgi:hypothetical protein